MGCELQYTDNRRNDGWSSLGVSPLPDVIQVDTIGCEDHRLAVTPPQARTIGGYQTEI